MRRQASASLLPLLASLLAPGLASAAEAAPSGAAAGASHPFMIPPGRLDHLRKAAADRTREWRALEASVRENLDRPDLGDTGVMNVAVAYLATGDVRYCQRLSAEARRIMATANPRGDSYYGFASIMGSLATVLGHCGPLLDAGLRAEIATYLDTWTDELWFRNKGTGWGLKDPGNNYHVSFLLGTAWAALALDAVGHPRAPTYLDIVKRGVDGELAYLAERCKGGGWNEGTNYGDGSKGRLGDLLSLLAAAGVRNAFRESEWFADALLYAQHQLQPGNVYLFPYGDMSRESNMTVNAYERQYVQQYVYWLADSPARAAGQWYLEHVAPDYRVGFNHQGALWRELIFKLDLPSLPQASLPLVFRAEGDGFVSMRSGWDARATALMVSAASRIDQSHAHLDTGGFTLWKEDWQLVDAVTYSHSGLLQEAGAHNLVHVRGARKVDVTSKGIVSLEADSRVSHLRIDATGLYSSGARGGAGDLLREFTRELAFLPPDTVVVYDRVEPRSADVAFDWRLHFPEKPVLAGDTVRSTHGGGAVTVRLLAGDAPAVLPDTDLEPDGSRSWRLQATSPAGRFLAVARVGSGKPPAVDAVRVTGSRDVEGVALGEDVVLFSARAFGAPPRVPFTYAVPAVRGRVHTLLGMEGSVRVSTRREGDRTVVAVESGGDLKASPGGLIRFTEP